MRITWITRSFLDYRVPVYEELNRAIGGGLTLLYYGDVVPERVSQKVRRVLGAKAVALQGERRLAGVQVVSGDFANQGIRIPYQPGLIAKALASRPEVVVSDGFFQWTYAALWLRATRGIPHVMCYEPTAHTDRHAQWYRLAYRRVVVRWIDAMCCNGQLCGQHVQHLGFPGARITYGHMVADVDGLRQSASHVSPEQISRLAAQFELKGLVFLYVGRLVPRKGVRQLLEAWNALFASLPAETATLLFVGNGPQQAELEQYCADRRLTNVRFAGAVDYDALAPFYRAAQVFVIPTLEDNWSLVVPEAMACGLPILCSQYNGCWPEYVTPDNGWVFDPLAPTAVTQALREVISNRDRLSQMGARSQKIVGAHTASHAAQAIYRACELARQHAPPQRG